MFNFLKRLLSLIGNWQHLLNKKCGGLPGAGTTAQTKLHTAPDIVNEYHTHVN